MRDNVTLLAGTAQPEGEPWAPFSPESMDFLSALSHTIRASQARGQEEVAAFGFWCRRAHLEALRARHASPLPRLGRGLVFHLAPANVPGMFAYSFAIALLAGNASILRLSTRRGPVEEALCAHLRQTLDRPEFAAIRARTCLVSYDRDSATTAAYMARCDGRIIWGGDETVAAMRSIPMPPHAVELCFPDRWSLSLLSQAHLSSLDAGALDQLAHRFYNDTYLMDQNACSSPQMVVWLDDGGDRAVRRRWWRALAGQVQERYPLGPLQSTQKYALLCRAAMTLERPPVAALERYLGNRLYVARLEGLPTAPLELKGGFGLFFESETPTWAGLLPLLGPKVQTLSCAGVDPGAVAAFLQGHRARGVDRVVSLGQALEMDTIWDGKDLIAALSRLIG